MSEELRSHLMQSDEEFRKLSKEHQELEELLSRLSSQHYPTEQEQEEEREVKRRKLALKDRMAEIVSRAQSAGSVAGRG